jgi:hypothetical protein
MAHTVLTYRGVKYERPEPMAAYLLNQRLQEQRREFEAKLDRLRMKNNADSIV